MASMEHRQLLTAKCHPARILLLLASTNTDTLCHQVLVHHMDNLRLKAIMAECLLPACKGVVIQIILTQVMCLFPILTLK